MRYPAGYKQQKRQELLQISGQLAKQQGFAATGVDSFMQAAGMTSGAFYSHFSSKQELFKALIETELQQSFAHWQNNPHHSAAEWIDFEMERYLTLSHLKHPDQGCVLPALAAEIGRADHDIQQAYQQELMRGHALFAAQLGSEEKAWAMLCQLVGAILIARAMPDPAVQQLILTANKSVMRDYLNAQAAENSAEKV